jgi:hypothetical protein
MYALCNSLLSVDNSVIVAGTVIGSAVKLLHLALATKYVHAAN